jgi:hypothetical protein
MHRSGNDDQNRCFASTTSLNIQTITAALMRTFVCILLCFEKGTVPYSILWIVFSHLPDPSVYETLCKIEVGDRDQFCVPVSNAAKLFYISWLSSEL